MHETTPPALWPSTNTGSPGSRCLASCTVRCTSSTYSLNLLTKRRSPSDLPWPRRSSACTAKPRWVSCWAGQSYRPLWDLKPWTSTTMARALSWARHERVKILRPAKPSNVSSRMCIPPSNGVEAGRALKCSRVGSERQANGGAESVLADEGRELERLRGVGVTRASPADDGHGGAGDDHGAAGGEEADRGALLGLEARDGVVIVDGAHA